MPKTEATDTATTTAANPGTAREATARPWHGRMDGLIVSRVGNVRFILRIERHGPAATLDDEDRACMDLVLNAVNSYSASRSRTPSTVERNYGAMVVTLLQEQFDEARELALTPEVQFDVNGPFIRLLPESKSQQRIEKLEAALVKIMGGYGEPVSAEIARTALTRD